ncbi:MAG: recombinase family protein [Lachnospiraceae bacterium]|nr:recombinase family protein [Lachnospiraceae bacterium]
MGRISKRKGTALKEIPEHKKQHFKTGIYARLSSNNDKKKNESVEIQIEIAKKFVEEFNTKQNRERMEIAKCYTDLGKTGSNFNRDGFRELMQDIRFGDINCVIVKDLSRFGRNYLETGNYIEKIFPFLGVRFIAVADGFDTGKLGNNTKQIASEIKNLINEMYVKDSSKKAKIQLKQKREEGSYVGGPPPYGYLSQWDGKIRKLVPDPCTSMIVQLIYNLFLEKESYAGVTAELNRQKINPPAIYKKKKEVYYLAEDNNYKGWDKSSVERILQNQTYIGTLIQGKTSITARNEKNRKAKPQEEWTIKKNVHQSLIDSDDYKKVQNIREKIQRKTAMHKNAAKSYPNEEKNFKLVHYCGEHGRKISEKELMNILFPFMRMVFAIYLKKIKYYIECGKEIIEKHKVKIQFRQKEIEKRLIRAIEKEGTLYIDYHEGKITEEDYISFKTQQEKRVIDLKKQKEEQEEKLKKIEKASAKYLTDIRSLIKLKNETDLKKEMLENFMEEIYVYPGKRVEIILTFASDYRKEGKVIWEK